MASRQLPSKFRKVTISFMIGSVWHDLTKGKAGTGTKFRKSSEIRASPRFGLRGLGFRQQSDGGDVADGGQRDDETDQHRAMVGDQSHQWGQNSAAYDGGDHQAGKLVGVLRQGLDGGGKDEREDVGESQANDETGGNSEGRGGQEEAKQSHDGNPAGEGEKLARRHPVQNHAAGKPSDGKGDEEQQGAEQAQARNIDAELLLEEQWNVGAHAHFGADVEKDGAHHGQHVAVAEQRQAGTDRGGLALADVFFHLQQRAHGENGNRQGDRVNGEHDLPTGVEVAAGDQGDEGPGSRSDGFDELPE